MWDTLYRLAEVAVNRTIKIRPTATTPTQLTPLQLQSAMHAVNPRLATNQRQSHEAVCDHGPAQVLWQPTTVDSSPLPPGSNTEAMPEKTHDDDESLVAEPSMPPAAPSLYHFSPFPSDDYPVFFPTRESIPLRLNFALYPVTRFSDEFWKKIWGQTVLVLDSYLVTPEEQYTSTTAFFHPETEFIGMKYRLKIDSEKCHQPLVFQCDDVVDVSGINGPSGRYVVETCQLIRDGFTYLSVQYRNFHGQGFTDTRDPRHPSFILQIPQSFCKSPLILHLQALPLSTSVNSYPFSCLSPTMGTLSSLYMTDEYSAKKRYFCIC